MGGKKAAGENSKKAAGNARVRSPTYLVFSKYYPAPAPSPPEPCSHNHNYITVKKEMITYLD